MAGHAQSVSGKASWMTMCEAWDTNNGTELPEWMQTFIDTHKLGPRLLLKPKQFVFLLVHSPEPGGVKGLGTGLNPVWVCKVLVPGSDFFVTHCILQAELKEHFPPCKLDEAMDEAKRNQPDIANAMLVHRHSFFMCHQGCALEGAKQLGASKKLIQLMKRLRSSTELLR